MDSFLALLEPKEFNHTALYNDIVSFFNDNDIPYKNNMIGFASDGASVMMGCNNSVMTLLKRDIPSLFVMKCVCHSLALCVSHATEQLPPDLEVTIRETYSYLKYSAKRLKNFEVLQEMFNVPKHQMLKLFKIRWLSLEECVDRVIEQYPVLLQLFEEEGKTALEAKEIWKKLKNPFFFLYLKFLEFVLPLIVDRNKKFQSEKPQIHSLYTEMEGMYCTILEFYIDER